MPLHLRRQAIARKAIFCEVVVLQRYPVLIAIDKFLLTPGHGFLFTRRFQRLKLLRRNSHGINTAVFFNEYGCCLGLSTDKPNRFLACVAVICIGDFRQENLAILAIAVGLPNAFVDRLNESNVAPAAAFECRSTSLACGPHWSGMHSIGASLVCLG